MGKSIACGCWSSITRNISVFSSSIETITLSWPDFIGLCYFCCGCRQVCYRTARTVMSILRQDLHYAIRQLRKNPGFTILVTLTIALGIGANTAIFSVINGFLRPLPARSPEEIVVLAADTKGDETGFQYRFSFPALEDLRKNGESFSDVFAF